MSWIVSLGAGREQVPLIRAIQAEGYACFAIDKDMEAPGFSLADHQARGVSNRDVEHIYSLLSCFDPGRISAIMAAASEVPDVMAILAHKLGIPGIPVAAGLLLKDKLRYKQVLKAAGVPCTEAHPIQRGWMKTIFDQLGYEVVIKPQRGSGSRGVSLVRHAPMELEIAYSAAEEVCPDVLMERYQPGPQISSETLIWDEVADTVAFVDRFYDRFGHEVGGSAPSHWEEWRGRATQIIDDAARALGIRSGTLKGDLVLTEDGPVIIELTCRLSGGSLFQVVRESEGVDYVRQAVRIAAGKEPIWELMTPVATPNRVALDLQGNKMDWEWSRKFIEKELRPWRR